MRVFAGIDGGQSTTTAVVADETGRVLGRGRAGGADEIGQSAGSTRLRDALAGALADACARAGLSSQTRFTAIVAGISGYDGNVRGQAPLLPTKSLALMHDAPIAHCGALAGVPGIVVIAGTGSVAYGIDAAGRSVTVGGWGYLFGDEGSAFWLARRVLSDAMSESEAGNEHELLAMILKFFAAPSLRALARSFYTGTIGREHLAAFAVEVVAAVRTGNSRVAGYIIETSTALGVLAMRTARALDMPKPQIALTGGLLRNPILYDGAALKCRVLIPASTCVEPRYDGAVGALLIAYANAGVRMEEVSECT